MSTSKEFKCPHCYRNYKSRDAHKKCKKRDESELASSGTKDGDKQTNSESRSENFASRGTHTQYKKTEQESRVAKDDDEQTTSSNDSSSAGGIRSADAPKEVVNIPPEEEKCKKTLSRQKKLLYEKDVQKLRKLVDKMFENNVIEKSRNPKSEVLDFFTGKVKLRKQRMSEASAFFNPVVRAVQKHLKDGTNWTWQFLKSGSFYDGTKVSRPDEMDCMFVPNLKDVLVVCTSGDSKCAPTGFCYLKLTKPHPGLQPFCEGDYLSSTWFRNYVFRCLESLPQSNRKISRDTTLSEGSPSFGVNYDTGLTNDDGTKFIISMDLVPALHFNGWPDTARDFSKEEMERLRNISKHGFHVVAKEYDGKDRHLLWRLSFSKAEKILTKYADSLNIEPDSDDGEGDDAGWSLEEDKEKSLEEGYPRTGKGNGSGRKSKATTVQEEGRGEDRAGIDTGKGLSLPPNGKAKGSKRKAGPGEGRGRGSHEEGTKTCRKKVLRIVKRMLEIVKDKEEDSSLVSGLNVKSREVSAALRRAAQYVRSLGYTVDKHKFTTFQLRTLMWNVFYKTTLEDHVWAPGNIICRVDDVLMKLKKMLTGDIHVEHFFIRGLDIMAEVPLVERQYLYIMVCVIEKYL